MSDIRLSQKILIIMLGDESFNHSSVLQTNKRRYNFDILLWMDHFNSTGREDYFKYLLRTFNHSHIENWAEVKVRKRHTTSFKDISMYQSPSYGSLRVAFTNFPPLFTPLPGGNFAGIDLVVWQTITKHLDVSLEIVLGKHMGDTANLVTFFNIH